MKENRSVSRILSILELISKHKEGLTLGQIYRMLGIPKATAYDFLQTLYAYDAVYYKDPILKNYVIGSKMFAIGSGYTTNSNLIEASQFKLQEYADKYAKTVFICKKTEHNLVFIYKYQPINNLIVTKDEIGTIKTFEENNPISNCFRIFTSNDLDEKDQEQKDKGYVLSDKTSKHIFTICIPIKNFENKVTGVIAASDLFDSSKPDEKEAIADLVELGKKVSKRLGYLGE